VDDDSSGARTSLRFARLTMASDEATLDALNREYIRSVSEADVGWFDAHLAPDFVNSNPDGSLVDRVGFLAQIGRGSTVKGLAIEDVLIRELGDVALIHARTTYTRADGQPGAGRYTDVWAKRGDRWMCVAANVTRL
jgi:ketosteroid isomerase-like protein